MAIQVGGTTVINNSRALSNITSVDATTAAAIEAAGVGGGGAIAWDPSSTPDVNLTSSGTWTKPGGLASTTWIFVYMVGGGGAGRIDGTWAGGGAGGGAHIFSGLSGEFPSSVAFTIGSGSVSSGGGGGDTQCTINGTTYVAEGGSGYTSSGGALAQGGDGTGATPYAGASPFVPISGAETAITQSGYKNFLAGGYGGWAEEGGNATYGAGGGGNNYSSYPKTGGTSDYAGNGGNGGSNGTAPGGGGGGNFGSGANGSVRIWYVEEA